MALGLVSLLTACGRPDGDGRHPEAADAAPRPAAAAAAPAAGPAATASGAASGPASQRAPSGPAASRPAAGTGQGPRATVPDSRLTPATGSFTRKEKKYLSGRVPAGTDPAAILQAGQDTCDRLAYTAKIDRDAAVGAVVAGDIKGAEAAVDGLCPELKPLVAAAEGGYADGTHTAPAPGTYRALTPSPDCSWSLDGTSGTRHTITVRKGTRTLTSSGCYAWART
ncbi:hypothetical protein [Streptomyces sp. NPDC003697]